MNKLWKNKLIHKYHKDSTCLQVLIILVLINWIAGFSFLIPQIAQYWLRVGSEEEMMIEHFGDEYRLYTETTGRLFPKF
jgi:protein-S-isoprenylcysteine O-methyltransferase Ste14